MLENVFRISGPLSITAALLLTGCSREPSANASRSGDRSLVLALAVLGENVSGRSEVEELDHQPETVVHETEIGDLDGDGVLEIYATPTAPNLVDGTPQPGKVVRYVPAKGEGRTVVADLGERHAKEILVTDLDGDGRDELYVSVEAVAGERVEIRRYLANTDPRQGELVVTIEDTSC